MFLFKYIRRLFQAAFPLPALFLPATPASASPSTFGSLERSAAPCGLPLGCVKERASNARAALSRFRLGPYANGPP
jgi:hypothetical protein